MPRRKMDAKFKRGFLERTRMIRDSADYTQVSMATALGVDRETYKQYETRTPLPHDLIPRFLELTGHDPWFLLTGRPQREAPKGKASKNPPLRDAG